MQDAARCFWDGFEPAAVHFCERELCAFIEQPANTWSNLAYIIVGAVICRVAIREGRASLATFGVISIVLGLGSMFFHGSSTHIGEVIDVGAMYLLSSYVLVLNWRRLRRRHDGPWLAGDTWAFVLLSGSAIVVVSTLKGVVGILLFCAHVISCGAMENRIRRHRDEGVSYRPMLKLLGAFAIAWTLWWIDILELNCNPDNHVFQGHAGWHIANSMCLWFAYRFYAQLHPSGDTKASG